MKPIIPACLLLVAFTSVVASSNDEQQKGKPITNAQTVFAVYTEDWGLASSGTPNLILAVWDDGQLVWSEDRLHGGSPYRTGQIAPKKLTALLSHMEQDGMFADKKLAQSNFGPDSQFTTILLKSGKHQLKMQSWHELFEENGKVVATKSGIVPLNGRRRLDVLQMQPPEYLYYRLVWGAIRASSSRLIPSNGKSVEGRVLMKAGIMSWEEVLSKTGRKEPVITVGLAADQDAERKVRRDRMAWVAKCLKDFQAIKVGMTRKEIEMQFQQDGGLQGVSPVRFTHPDCPYFKVDVEFSFKRNPQDMGRAMISPDDKGFKTVHRATIFGLNSSI